MDSAAGSPQVGTSTVTTASKAETITSQSSGSLSPPTFLHDLQSRIDIAVRESTHAETLHAYDIGVMATLESMKKYWAHRSNNLHISVSEKRIFRRETERLDMLLAEAREETQKSDKALEAKLRAVERLRRGLGEEIRCGFRRRNSK
ncbi:hypothetical protein QBC33DRAFT_561756 [Phialemonium atrogriseum]|uniref:Uncharacterized protein n=1 Tax=Phialemonium atrogriseum TaxID=1093897 RepID=A0AAJ0BTS5_9PEZI|nr:uncharacterized protein QBC33DRAFT_561756 [Phialemonium atrogriseum]KAK1764363.1 hypothetical protein QBC33DRAFT_561756 [Phialemonium atrogriseum]